jgi:phosphatidate cytidylyltransferase
VTFFALVFMEMMLSGMKLPFQALGVCFAGGLVLPFLLGAIGRIYMTENGRALALIPFAIAFLSDSGAYFGGMLFGKHKLAPVVSPKKTIEGSVGGALGTIIGTVIIILAFEQMYSVDINMLAAILITPVLSVIGMLGDLVMSAIKRTYGIKDYGNIMPGHGGVLDRVDSVLLVAPAFILFLSYCPLV